MPKPHQQEIFNPIVAEYVKQIQHEVKYLKKLINQWEMINCIQKKEETMQKSDGYLIKQYINYQYELYEFDQFKEGFQVKKVDLHKIQMGNVETDKQIYLSVNLFSKAYWPIRFNTKFVSRMSDYRLYEMYHILGYAYYLACGNVLTKKQGSTGYVRELQGKRIPLNRFFACKMFAQKNLFLHVGVQKIPITKNGIIKRFQFVSYMEFLDILNEAFVVNKKKCDQRLAYFYEAVVSDSAKKSHVDLLIPEIKRQKFSYYNDYYLFTAQKNEYSDTWEYPSINIQTFVSGSGKKAPYIFHPLKFDPYYISNEEASSFKYNEIIQRWITKEDIRQMQRKKYQEYQKQASSSIMRRFIDFQSAKTLVQLLTKIPNFKINLTEQQKDVIGENGNVLAIGRSGTGKTTCAVLRLFSIEMLFKLRLALYKKKELKKSDTPNVCGSSDIDETFGLHCIFLTASPVLTHEIQRYYKKLTDNIKAQLQKKKKRIEEQNKKKLEAQNLQKKLNEDAQILQVPENMIKTLSQEQIKEIQEHEIKEELQDIQIKEDMQGFQEDQDIDEFKNKMQQDVKQFNSLYDLKEQDYPGFFTVKHFIMMIDGLLDKPFFIRKAIDITQNTDQTSWHNEKKGVMMIQNYHKGQEPEEKEIQIQQIQEFNYSDEEQLEHEYLRQIQLKENKEKQNLTKKMLRNKLKNKLSFEVDYQSFLINFWPTVNKKYYTSNKITAHLVWTEIYSTIKGSAQSHQYPFQYLVEKAYLQSTSNTFLTHQERLDVYACFCKYERWKISAGGYDIMDTVNYILNCIRYNRGMVGPQIHYLMIDQIQDLPHAIVYLLSKTTSNYIFYSGDTAQTIAKGVGFRFCDLKSLFNPKIFAGSLEIKPPVLKHLTVNFRSHNNILQLANSIVSCLEILFPKTIDRLKKEISDLHGPKPILLSSGDEQLLFNVLCGVDDKIIPQNDGNFKKPPLEFGCDQVIIVRNLESKKNIPSMLQHALCLTIYEAKGLQFNDVILFNFFTESPCHDKWNLIKSLNVINTSIGKEEYLKNLSRHTKKEQPKQQLSVHYSQARQKIQQNAIQVEQQVEFEESFNKETNTYNVKKITSNLHANFRDINDYAQLCSELKLLYTAITRPRKTLIIYDQKESLARSSIEKLWEKLNVVEIITKDFVMEELNKKSTNNEEVKLFKMIVSSNLTEWKKQGLKMYSRGYFDQAIKCFQRSGDKQLLKKGYANKYADEATKKLIEVQSERNGIKEKNYQFQAMTPSQIAKYKRKLKIQEQNSLQKFKKAGEIFEDLVMFKQAGQCYFSGKVFQKSFECFCKAFMYRQAAESLQMHNKYRQAAQYYTKDNNYLKTIQCLDMINQWQQILKKIQFFSHIMTEEQKTPLLKKYSALALQELVYQIQFQNEEESKKPENNMVQVIEQKQSEQEEYDSDQDPQIAAERQYSRKISEQNSNSNPSRKQSGIQSIPSRKQSQLSEEGNLIEIKDSVYQKLEEKDASKLDQQKVNKAQISMSFSQLNNSNVEQAEGLKSVQESFGDLNKSLQPVLLQNNPSSNDNKLDIQSLESSFGQLNAKYDNDLLPDLQSIKSLVDPDDLWVRNSISEIGNILQSQYSVIDSESNFNANMKIIKTKDNIVVHDKIMKKIVTIVSIINDNVHEFFKNFKGYQSLITVDTNKEEDAKNEDKDEFLDDFLEIDPKFLDIILDTLESFKLFKLCLFVCNRYHFPSKAGRYLISLGMKYSTNCISNNSMNPNLLAPSAYRKAEIQKGILASIAIHSIYENVNPAFLKIKITQSDQSSKNNLGYYFIQGLVLQGLYKKAVFMVDVKESLRILTNYNDYQTYSNLYRQKIKDQEDVGELKFLQTQPSTKIDIQFTKILLKKVILQYCIVSRRTEVISLRYYKQFQSNPQNKALKRFNVDIPDYLPFTKILLDEKNQLGLFVEKMKELIMKGHSILTKGNSIQILDLVSTLMVIALNNAVQNQITLAFTSDEFLELYRCLKLIKFALKKIQGLNIESIIDAVLSFYQCYSIKPCKSMIFLRDSYCFIHRTSIIANELIQNYKSNPLSFSFFFQQDYNLILSKTSKIIRIVSRKFNQGLIQLYTSRIHVVHENPIYFYQDVMDRQEQQILKKALRSQVNQLLNRKTKHSKQKKKQKKPEFDYKNQLKMNMVIVHYESEDENEQENVSLKNKHYKLHNNPRLSYIGHHLVKEFNENAKDAKEIIQGRNLYGCGLNNFYREYLVKKGGYNLFDAFEFYKFKRVDLFAENILSIFDDLTLYTKHELLGEILILLLIQYKTLKQPKGYTLYTHTENLKYFQNLQYLSSQSKLHNQIKPTRSQLYQLVTDNIQCEFNYTNDKVCQMNESELALLICDYLNLLLQEQNSMFVDFPKIVLAYALNIKDNKDINSHLKKIINTLGPIWNKPSLKTLVGVESLQEYQNRRNHLLGVTRELNVPVHGIIVSNTGNLDKAIADSQQDYLIQGRIIQGRKRAVNKISKWWRQKKMEQKKKILKGNYFEAKLDLTGVKQFQRFQLIGNIRLMRVQHKGKGISAQIQTFYNVQKARDQLLSFYLINCISSSLDLHFILKTLNKLEDYRQKFFDYCLIDPSEITQLSLDDIKNNISQVVTTIKTWKNDGKWLKEKNYDLKKKKVFEVKWMSKNIGYSNMLRKRANLKKQQKLQQKKRFIKKTK